MHGSLQQWPPLYKHDDNMEVNVSPQPVSCIGDLPNQYGIQERDAVMSIFQTPVRIEELLGALSSLDHSTSAIPLALSVP